MAKKARQCKVGYSCGNTCISKKRVCQNVTTEASKGLMDDLAAAAGAAAKQKPLYGKGSRGPRKPKDKFRAEAPKDKFKAEGPKDKFRAEAPKPAEEPKDKFRAEAPKDKFKAEGPKDKFRAEAPKPVEKPKPKEKPVEKKKTGTFKDAVLAIRKNPRLAASPKNLIKVGDAVTKGLDFQEEDEEEINLKNSLLDRQKKGQNLGKEYQDDFAKWQLMKDSRVKKNQDQYDAVISRISEVQSKTNNTLSKSDLDKINMDKTLGSREAKTKEMIAEAGNLIGPRAFKTLNNFARDNKRAYASQSAEKVNIGLAKTEKQMRTSMYHEMAHHIEYNNPALREAARKFRDSKATSTEQKKLSEITGNKAYKDTEVALPGDYINPYMGKVYEKGTTEVLSLGFEHFADPNSMAKLAKKDPDHFRFIVGALLAN